MSEQKITVSGEEYDMPEGVLTIGEDDLYKVDLSLVEVEDGFNPRHITNKGFDDDSMESLMNSIRNQGLLNPIICRWNVADDKLKMTLVEGERRFHCMNKLIEKKDKVWNREKKAYVPAAEAFESIHCRIVVATRDEALQYAAQVQENTIDWGDGAKTALVRKMRQEGYTDERILTIFSKSPNWLREEDRICNLDDTTWNAYIGLKINRKVALDLVKVEDEEKRHKYLNAACQEAVKRYEEEIAKLDEQIEASESREELAEAELAIAEQHGDEEMADSAKDKLEKAKKKTEAKKEEKEKKKPQAKTNDLVRGANQVSDGVEEEEEDKPKNPLRPGKIKKLKALLEKVYEDDGQYEGEQVMDKIDLLIPIACLRAILEGDDDIIKVLERTQKVQKMVQRKRQEQPVAVPAGHSEEDEDDFDEDDDFHPEEVSDEYDDGYDGHDDDDYDDADHYSYSVYDEDDD